MAGRPLSFLCFRGLVPTRPRFALCIKYRDLSELFLRWKLRLRRIGVSAGFFFLWVRRFLFVWRGRRSALLQACFKTTRLGLRCHLLIYIYLDSFRRRLFLNRFSFGRWSANDLPRLFAFSACAFSFRQRIVILGINNRTRLSFSNFCNAATTTPITFG